MKVSEAKKYFFDYQSMNSKKNMVRNYERLLSLFCSHLGEREIDAINTEEILKFLTQFTEGAKQSTKRLRYSLLSAFFNFIRNSIDSDIHNPCDTPLLRKIFRHPKPIPWIILEKEVVDEMIFRTSDPRNRTMLELMARGGMRVGEVLKITPRDIDERKVIIREPKSGRET
jgi:site-specific recombinase XerD